MYISQLETRNFSFMSVGMTEKQSLEAMQNGLAVHDSNNQSQLSKAIGSDDINTFFLSPGQVMRDTVILPIGASIPLSVMVEVANGNQKHHLFEFPTHALGDILSCAKAACDDPSMLGELQEAVSTYWPMSSDAPHEEESSIDAKFEFEMALGKPAPDNESDTGEIENALIEHVNGFNMDTVRRLRAAGLHADAESMLKTLKLLAARDYSLSL
ncbi:hypothetical protein BM525_19465 (plasmid) [Alteromonas mediterranea]|uniref:Uncharacterized protein n=1 Tax=Alteromonas mediterranea TaxID=314275 RepID=A0AAC9JE69_9ALTE|nr:hypothetical protein [Alteromonas mediterranea]APD92063.1 hypothetical protein BM524_19270 [Alteromonas mediterranea]APD99917.1 hypothetical protein BM525_19465 [Alteromonas mediterranea]